MPARKTRRQKQRAAARQAAPIQGAATPDVDVVDQLDESEAADTALDAGPAGGPAGGADEPDTDESVGEAAVAAVATPAASTSGAPVRRRIERLSDTTRTAARASRPGRGPSNAAAMFQPLESDDAAIPIDRVPYVPADLRRVVVIAGFMVALIVIAAIVVSNVVH
ncbi:MAG: hypothetical protein ACREN2_07605 [Candidatus Dormibacteria bacterium]